jgi:hypothetical protein
MLDLAPHVALASGPLSGGERSSLVCNANRIGTAPRVPDLLRYEPKSPCLSEHACGHYRETKEPPREEVRCEESGRRHDGEPPCDKPARQSTGRACLCRSSSRPDNLDLSVFRLATDNEGV